MGQNLGEVPGPSCLGQACKTDLALAVWEVTPWGDLLGCLFPHLWVEDERLGTQTW